MPLITKNLILKPAEEPVEETVSEPVAEVKAKSFIERAQEQAAIAEKLRNAPPPIERGEVIEPPPTAKETNPEADVGYVQKGKSTIKVSKKSAFLLDMLSLD
jgi:hypothetical protein